MANDEHVALLKLEGWNAWRDKNPDIRPDLSEAELSLEVLFKQNLSRANLGGADLGTANLSGADLMSANLTGANLESAILVNTDLTGADLTGCRIHGVSAWRLTLERAKQQNLVITRKGEP